MDKLTETDVKDKLTGEGQMYKWADFKYRWTKRDKCGKLTGIGTLSRQVHRWKKRKNVAKLLVDRCTKRGTKQTNK
jgi:hypothetical protein